MKFVFALAFLLLTLFSRDPAQSLKISRDQRFFTQADGQPFFWLGDTGWLLLKKCSREETIRYLDTRQRQGFNVVQVMLLHDVKDTRNFYGDEALTNSDAARPLVTPGRNFAVPAEYDYWDHVEWVIDQAAKRGIFMALVPVWGSNVKAGLVSEDQALTYAKFLAERFGNKPNIIWLNGGDLRGDDHQNVWKAIGSTLRKYDKNHLISFHPRGRTSSSEWFHNESWLDFDMFQSGHRNYAQDNSPEETHHFGEDNWRYAEMDRRLKPAKPTFDGEPSYENIPQGLHDPNQPRWNDADVRRYAYWSVFSGGAGFTYGENSVFQFYKKGDKDPAYGAEKDWRETIDSPGANQLQFLKKLMLSRAYFERTPAEEMVADQAERYDRIAATKGIKYAFLYTYTGRSFVVKLGILLGKTIRYSWFDPRTGERRLVGTFANKEEKTFDPPGEERPGNDWVLVLESSSN